MNDNVNKKKKTTHITHISSKTQANTNPHLFLFLIPVRPAHYRVLEKYFDGHVKKKRLGLNDPVKI